MTENTKLPSSTMALAEYVAKASYDDLPVEVREKAKLHVLDSVGNMIGGSTTDPGKIVLQLFQEMGGRPESTILATGQKVPCLHAAYVNSTLSNMLDFDDIIGSAGHPGATVVPPALAVAESLGINGREFLNAVVLGYEVSIRAGEAIRPSPERFRKVWGMATWQIIGTVVAAARLMSLDAAHIATAIGFAVANAPLPASRKHGLERDDRPMTWLKANLGWASLGGVFAARLAAREFVGHKYVLDGDKGFWVMAGSDRCDFPAFTRDLGRKYLILRAGFKPYACCRWAHTSLDALSGMLGQHTIDPSKVKRVLVQTYSEVADALGDPRPQNVVDAQFSLPAVIALTLRGYPLTKGLAMEHLEDNGMAALRDKVQIEADPRAEEEFFKNRTVLSTVTIEMMNGERFTATERVAKGDPEKPMTLVEMKQKFLNLASPVIGQKNAQRTMDRILHLEELEDAGVIAGGKSA